MIPIFGKNVSENADGMLWSLTLWSWLHACNTMFWIIRCSADYISVATSLKFLGWKLQKEQGFNTAFTRGRYLDCTVRSYSFKVCKIFATCQCAVDECQPSRGVTLSRRAKWHLLHFVPGSVMHLYLAFCLHCRTANVSCLPRSYLKFVSQVVCSTLGATQALNRSF